MRLLLGALILLTCFAVAALWQLSWTSAARLKREPFPAALDSRSPAQPGDGWSRVVLGRPSDGEPYLSSAEAMPAPPSSHRPEDPPKELARPTTIAEDAQVTVLRGQTLSEICREHYGTARHELVLAVVAYNHLAEADEIREGQELLLPSPEKMLVTR